VNCRSGNVGALGVGEQSLVELAMRGIPFEYQFLRPVPIHSPTKETIETNVITITAQRPAAQSS
jgi:hypothetical protein